MKKLVFACGAYIECQDHADNQVGSRLVTHTVPHQSHQVPAYPDGKPVACCWACPSTVKASGRKTQWVRHCVEKPDGSVVDGERGRLTTCRIVEIVEA